ncbi:hypothetical protein G3A1_008 [Escherichia phage vB_EcoP-G3A1]|uniref:Uncharacterized protein n=1 Tax=Escherichia phage vB_EcoP-101117UKE2 TaxID=2865796 RepID=A0AAE7XSZ5_9CAUD|nr:hypothetical protein 101117UKE2_008 [Escherichia phage vB_EcoP-101117UKE2]QZI79633.1 hypothetical protein 101118B1_008 [Escherichia phage vB_EcoP-101118B1]QZI81237.1 hypothetical protein G3A1_008 [Escherichia phage vB_EcoP-G3A1]
MTKVLIYMRGANKCYAVVAPDGVKPYGTSKGLALIGASRSASFQMELFGHWTEKEFREEFNVIGSFMVKHAK